MDFSWLPPEVNSARIFGGAGAGPLVAAAKAWAMLGTDLHNSSAAFQNVLTRLASGPWSGPAALSMAAAASPYVAWMSAAAAQADLSAAQARAAAAVFETALAGTVHPAAVAANRAALTMLVATNFLGQNTALIAATEFDYVEMWAQDVAAMVGYDAGAMSVAAALMPFEAPPMDLVGLAGQVGAQVNAQTAGMATAAAASASPMVEGAVAEMPAVVAGAQAMAAAVPVETALGVSQAVALPASMLIGPMMQLGQTGTTASAAGLYGAEAAGMARAEGSMLAGDIEPMKGLGAGSGMAADLGRARLVGAMSVPPTWEGSMPKGTSSAAMSGLGAKPVGLPAGAAAGGGMPMMPMPMGAGGAGAGMPGGMMGRGGANPHVVQGRPSVIPRTGVG